MKKPYLLLRSTLLTSCLMTGLSASAFEIDTLENIGSVGTAVTSRIIDGVNVSLTTGGGQNMESRRYADLRTSAFAFAGINAGIDVDAPYNNPLNPANVSGSYFISNDGLFGTLGGLTFEFDSSVKSFGLTTLDLMENIGDLGSDMELALRAYDASGLLVAEHARSGNQGSSGLDLDWVVTSLANDITRITLTGNIPRGRGYGIDDLLVDAGSSTAVPAPASLFLLVPGLVALRKRLK